MENGIVPIEKAFEPEEEAHQPSPQNMSRSQTKKQNINFSDNEKTDSQTSSNYKDILSQPARDLSHRQRLLWLQKRRTKGLWVQCDDCDKWRYMANVLDRYELPKKWYCRMNPDTSLASCSAPEVPIRIHDEEDLIHSEYAAGSLVLARVPGWPWWPAMVDDCPDTEQYYWLDGFSDIPHRKCLSEFITKSSCPLAGPDGRPWSTIVRTPNNTYYWLDCFSDKPTHYNVVFFDAFEVTRAWMAPAQLKPYSENKNLLKTSLKRKYCSKRLEVAITQADDAERLPLSARLNKYSFIARYKGTICSPKKITKNDMKKYHDRFKRKFNIDLPDESDSDNEIQPKQPHINNRNVITLGKVKKNNGNNENVSNKANGDGKESSLIVQVDTNSDLVRNGVNGTSTMYPDTLGQTNIVEDSQKTLQRTTSTASDDFDF